LLGSLLAKPGATFVFWHACEVAPTCPVARTCQNLEAGRAYQVLSKRPIHHDVCTEHEGGVDAVEVEPLAIVTSVEASKLRGTLVKWTPLVCENRTCPNWWTCFNPAMRPGGEYKIVSNKGAMDCPIGYRIERVEVEANRPTLPG
jgi:uncharacterized protein (UPF0179 family)